MRCESFETVLQIPDIEVMIHASFEAGQVVFITTPCESRHPAVALWLPAMFPVVQRQLVRATVMEWMVGLTAPQIGKPARLASDEWHCVPFCPETIWLHGPDRNLERTPEFSQSLCQTFPSSTPLANGPQEWNGVFFMHISC
jgi:hypothetical protein